MRRTFSFILLFVAHYLVTLFVFVLPSSAVAESYLLPEYEIYKNKPIPKNWLEKLFPSVTNCADNLGQFYYESKIDNPDGAERTSNGVLERLGYEKPYYVDKYVAKYKINELFYGMKAEEIAIPSNTFADYWITVSGTAKELAKRIYKKTGKYPNITKKGSHAQNGIAELIDDGNKSQFFCSSFEE